MFSPTLPNRPLLVRMHLPALLLPLLALSSTFSSKPIYPDAILHQIFSSSFILCAIIVFYRESKYNVLAIVIPISLVFIRIARFRYGQENLMLETFYFVPYSILLLGVGAKMVRDYPFLLIRQMMWICAISVVLLLMQIMGVQWAQSLTNFYWYRGGANESYLFVWWKDLPATSGIQERPVGFTSANNVLSQYLSFFYAFGAWWFASKKKLMQLPLKWIFIISFACALTGSKLVISIIILINITIFFLFKERSSVFFVRLLLLTLFAYAFYFLLFPGLFISNFNLDLFAFNAMLRLQHLSYLVNIPYKEDIFRFLSQFQTGYYIGNRDVMRTLSGFTNRAEQMTGIGSLIRYAPVIIFGSLLMLPFWLNRLRKIVTRSYAGMGNLIIIMLVASVSSAAGGPFLKASYFWFFFSFGLYPLSVLLIKEPKNKGLKYPVPKTTLLGSIP